MENTPPIMRTGLMGNSNEITVDRHSPLGQRLISLVFVLVKRAATTAAKYCFHCKRTLVTPMDVHYALKYHARTFFAEEGFEKLEEETTEMGELVSRFVREDISSDEVVDTFVDEEDISGDEDDDDDEEEEEEEEERAAEKGEECSCEFCTAIRGSGWDAWDPQDPAEQFIKNHIDQVFAEKNVDI